MDGPKQKIKDSIFKNTEDRIHNLKNVVNPDGKNLYFL